MEPIMTCGLESRRLHKSWALIIVFTPHTVYLGASFQNFYRILDKVHR